MEYRDAYRLNIINFDVDPYHLYDPIRNNLSVFAVFAQDEISIGNNWKIFAGLRHDSYSTVGGTTNPRLALIYSPDADTSIKFLYGRAFQAPIPSQLNRDPESENPSPDPETTDTYEAVLDHYFDREFYGSLAVYRYQIDGIISQVGYDKNGYTVYNNLGNDTATGIESALVGNWDSGWKGRVSYSVLETRDDITRKSLSNAPEQIAKLQLSAPLAIPGLILSGQISYLAPRRDNSSNTLPSTTLVNTVLNYDKFWKNADASLGIYNLFDKTYNNVGVLDNAQAQLRQDGRTIQFKLTFAF